MSYISGPGGVTSRSATAQPVDQLQQGGRERAREGGEGSRFVPDLYPRRRPLGQQHTDTTDSVSIVLYEHGQVTGYRTMTGRTVRMAAAPCQEQVTVHEPHPHGSGLCLGLFTNDPVAGQDRKAAR